MQREYDTLKTQINILKQQGDVVLAGDFNAKLELNIPTKNIIQPESRNGTMLRELLEDTDSIAINIKEETCEWTRQNRKKPDERSVIDYIITTKKSAHKITHTRVDINGTHLLSGKEKSDHNTILFEMKNNQQLKGQARKIWKKGNKEDWLKVNTEIEQEVTNKNPKTYDELEKIILKAMRNHIGQATIRVERPQESKETKEKRAEKRKARTEFEEAIKNKHPDLDKKKDKYLKTQIALKEQIQKDETNRRNKTIETLIKEGGAKSQLFWKLRKKIIAKEGDANYDTKDEQGNIIEDPEQAKEHIANFYENLYQARTGDKEFEHWTNTITQKIQDITQEMQHKPPIPEITTEELNKAIKQLKRGKSCGPDDIPNEIFLEASPAVRKIILKTLNDIATSQNIPGKWQEGEIKRLYKGKGNKGKCSAERGITLASNFGKLFERIINNRTIKEVNISDAQVGGKKGRATVDHLLIVKEIIRHAKNRRKPLYLVFLDVTKAYDKAWLDAIMYVLYKQGLQSNLWPIIRNLNLNLTAKIRTKDGLTRPIKINDSIRQGGVLSVIEYAILMDEIGKEIQTEKSGIKLPNNTDEIGSLLWVDDVVLMSFDEKELQEMLETTYTTAKKYRIEFGKEKSQVMTINSKPTQNPTKFNLGPLELDNTKTYKYLGETLNEKGNIKDHIKNIKGKAEAAYQTIRMIAGNSNFRDIELETMWKLIESCILPIILYAAETWDNTKEQTKEINRILDNLIKRILQTPTTTPREALYMECGLLDIEHLAKIRQIMMGHRLKETASELITNTIDSNIKGGWKQRLEKTLEANNLQETDLQGTKQRTKTITNEKVKTTFKEKLNTDSQDKSKIKHLLDGTGDWKPSHRKPYLNRLTRNEASTIFKTRTRMIEAKANYKNKYKNNMTCRACGQETETQKHILQECTALHQTDESKVTQIDIFTEDIIKLKKTSRKINATLNKLSS